MVAVKTSKEVCDELRISYRQLDYVVRQDLIPGQGTLGSGVARQWTEEQIAALHEIVDARRTAREILQKARGRPPKASTRTSPTTSYASRRAEPQPERVLGKRTCSEPGCSTPLSSYNRETKCYLHRTPKSIPLP